jgi:DNA-binding XRE family transcriptional regulator
MEKNKYCPSLKLAYRISHVFGVGIDDPSGDNE